MRSEGAADPVVLFQDLFADVWILGFFQLECGHCPAVAKVNDIIKLKKLLASPTPKGSF